MNAPAISLDPLTRKHVAAVHLAEGHALAVWEGAVRSGKTVGTFVAWSRFVRSAPPGDLVMIGKTERTLVRNVIRPMQTIYGKRNVQLNRGEGEVTLFGRTVYLVGANDERSADKIRGMTLAGAYGDEMTIWPESFWAMLKTRLSVAGARFVGTTNPDGPAHWLLTDLDRCTAWLHHDGTIERFDDDERVKLDLARMSFLIDDNPTLPAKFVDGLRASFSGMFYRRFILGEWCLAQGVIYDSWDPGRHVVDDDIADVTAYHVAIDDGTAGTFAAQLLAINDERIVAARELRWNAKERQRQLTDAQKSTEFRRWLERCDDELPGSGHPSAIHVDPSATSLIRQLELDGHRGVVRKARNDVTDGIRYVASLLTMSRLQVHRSCTGLIAEFPGYVWDDKAAARGEDRPVKRNDHHLDALRYGVMGTADHWLGWTSTVARRQDV